MKRTSEAPASVLLTIGHSNHPFDVLVDLLRRHEVQLVADVRSSPFSRYASQFNKETLESGLLDAGFSYRFLGHALGGRPQDSRFYDPKGYVLYDRIAASPAFQREMAALLHIAADVRTVLLCGEEDPIECHRRLLLARVAIDRGCEVCHLRADGRMQNESNMADEERLRKTQGQLLLFDPENKQPWRSARPVSRKKRPSN